MDPLAMAGTALSILNKIKEQVKECEAAFVEARELNVQIQGFEVTIMMIPARARAENEEPPPEPKLEVTDVATSDASGVAAATEFGVQMKNFAVGKAKDKALQALEKSPIGVAVELFKIGKDLEPIFDEGVSPGAKLQEMKTLVDANGMRVYSDLEVMFQGMAFIVASALKSIKGATDVLMQMNEMGTPNCWWTCMPWKGAIACCHDTHTLRMIIIFILNNVPLIILTFMCFNNQCKRRWS
jgi:hypothetical protein